MLTDFKENIVVLIYLCIVVPMVLLLCFVDHFLPKRRIRQQTGTTSQ